MQKRPLALVLVAATALGLGVASHTACALTVAPGFTVTPFFAPQGNNTQPDSVAVDGTHVFVGYGDHVAKDGTDGKSSTIVEFSTGGSYIQTFTVPGHNDGVKVDPATHNVWALQNEDGNPNLVVINPATAVQTPYTFAAPANGGGYDDIAFLNGKAYLSESNPANNPNTAPAVVQATLNGSTVDVSTILLGNAAATNLVTKTPTTLNLQDPDSLTTDLAGDLVLTSQADNELIGIRNPGTASQAVGVLPLSDSASTAVSVDDSLFVPGPDGQIILADQATNRLYRITGPGLAAGLQLSSAADIGVLGSVDPATGRFAPVVSGLGSPRGLAYFPSSQLPEPASLVLIPLAVAGLAIRNRRKA